MPSSRNGGGLYDFNVILFIIPPYIEIDNFSIGGVSVDWDMFFNKIRIIEFTGVIIASLMLMGILLAAGIHGRLIMGALIYLISVFVDYMVAMGLKILSIEKSYNTKLYTMLGLIITIIIIAISALKFTALYSWKFYLFPVYFALWFIYLKYRIMVFGFKMAGLDKER